MILSSSLSLCLISPCWAEVSISAEESWPSRSHGRNKFRSLRFEDLNEGARPVSMTTRFLRLPVSSPGEGDRSTLFEHHICSTPLCQQNCASKNTLSSAFCSLSSCTCVSLARTISGRSMTSFVKSAEERVSTPNRDAATKHKPVLLSSCFV